jgi:TonB family protein
LKGLAGLALGLLIAAPAVAQAPGKSAWYGAPTAADVRAAYPARALAARLGGAATLSCDIAVTGRLTACVVVSETPRGYGFGAAALSLAGKFAMEPELKAGKPVAGGHVRLPIVFSLPGQSVKT